MFSGNKISNKWKMLLLLEDSSLYAKMKYLAILGFLWLVLKQLFIRKIVNAYHVSCKHL